MRTDLAHRSASNPLIVPAMVSPSRSDFVVECVLNPGAFEHDGRIGLLLRVAERPVQEKGWVSTAVIGEDGELEVVRFREGDVSTDFSDPRLIRREGVTWLTTLSHLRLAWSTDGKTFEIDDRPALAGDGPLERYGIEDARVARFGDEYVLTFTSVSRWGPAVGMAVTRDWRAFGRKGQVLPPHNKDCALLEQPVAGRYWMLHRPTVSEFSGNCIWSAVSDDRVHWGGHCFVAAPRPGMWDEARIGPGAAPIPTPEGLLEIYHGATLDHRYCLGLLLLDADDPSRVLARSVEPVMQPRAGYECSGFLGGVVFTNGHIVNGDRVTVFYGAADLAVCSADFSVEELLGSLSP